MKGIKKYSKSITAIAALIIIFSLAPIITKAQFDNDPDAPIDGGISLLIAAAVMYGHKKNKQDKI
jgi:hypothetical protein